MTGSIGFFLCSLKTFGLSLCVVHSTESSPTSDFPVVVCLCFVFFCSRSLLIDNLLSDMRKKVESRRQCPMDVEKKIEILFLIKIDLLMS